jgi:hypothetical protein
VGIPEARSPGYIDRRFESAILVDTPREKARLTRFIFQPERDG